MEKCTDNLTKFVHIHDDLKSSMYMYYTVTQK